MKKYIVTFISFDRGLKERITRFITIDAKTMSDAQIKFGEKHPLYKILEIEES